MSMLPTFASDEYKDGRTKQAFKDETDINRILARAYKTGTISHVNKYQGQYADFSDYDFFENQQKLARGREIFDELPAEVRNEFQNSPGEFFKYVNDPANTADLLKKLPALAAPGRQLVDVSGKKPPDIPPAKQTAVPLSEQSEVKGSTAGSGGSTDKSPGG